MKLLANEISKYGPKRAVATLSKAFAVPKVTVALLSSCMLPFPVVGANAGTNIEFCANLFFLASVSNLNRDFGVR